MPDGIEMIDVVHYAPPLGRIGGLANLLFVRSRIERIFAYRKKRVDEIFPLESPKTANNQPEISLQL